MSGGRARGFPKLVTARFAIYYAPHQDDPLWATASTWLGRDADSNAPMQQPTLPNIRAVTADPRLYGFHATLKPPMRLADGTGWDGFAAEVEKMAAAIAAFDLPPLAVNDIGGFLALCETEKSPQLQALSDQCVAWTDGFRAPPDDTELARRRGRGLRPAQEAMLTRWGYPHMFGTWFFHMTLTRRLTAEERAIYRPATEAYFAATAAMRRRVDSICVFGQREADAPFTLARRFPLLG